VPDEVASTSIADHLSDAGYRSSLVATYSCYFPFYEEVVLRKLIAAGCTHNVLMIDAARCAEAFTREDLRPRRAGRDYTLIPVKAEGAFHPKIFLRFGKSKGSMFVGSHNMTIAGFGMNTEITNVFQAEGPSIRATGGPIRVAFEYLRAFVPSELPDVVEAYESLIQGIPWVEGPLGAGDPSRALLTASSLGPTLWSQVMPLIPEAVSRAFICGPFFDPDLAFVKRVLSDIAPKKLIIGVDAESLDIDPKKATTLKGVRWVNVAGLPELSRRREGSHHYLHAKLLWFAGKRGELLVTGSANPSVAAYLASRGRRNAEAVVADRRAGVAAEIGVEALMQAPPVTASEWKAIAGRRADIGPARPTTSRTVLIATPTPEGFCIQAPMPKGTILRGMRADGALLGEAAVKDPAGTLIEASIEVREEACYLESDCSEAPFLVIVHRTEDIARNLGGDTRKALRQALGALEEDPSQLEALLKLTEKVIFDADDVVRIGQQRLAATPTRSEVEAQGPASLALEALGRKAARKRRSLASGDIVVLLDALLRRLGEGLPVGAPLRPRSEEEQIGADEEEGGELAHDAPKYDALAAVCRGKVRRLVTRLEKQFEVAEETDLALRAMIQLAAVLGVVRTLRIIEQRREWREKHLELVNREDEWRLLEIAVRDALWEAKGLAMRALAESGGEWFEELSFVVGLVAWLSWEVQVNIEEANKRGGLQGVEDDGWFPIQLLAAVGPWISGDLDALRVLTESISRTPRRGIDGDHWLSAHMEFLEGFAGVVAQPEKYGQIARSPHPGDLVVLNERIEPRVRVVLKAWRGSHGTNLRVYDPWKPSAERAFVSTHVRSLPWPRVKASELAVSS
jgi:hypothetical protein